MKETDDLKGDVSLLKKKISYLEEELLRKDSLIESLKKENDILFNTALKKSQDKINNE